MADAFALSADGLALLLRPTWAGFQLMHPNILGPTFGVLCLLLIISLSMFGSVLFS